jgi:hypothetical protein
MLAVTALGLARMHRVEPNRAVIAMGRTIEERRRT